LNDNGTTADFLAADGSNGTEYVFATTEFENGITTIYALRLRNNGNVRNDGNYALRQTQLPIPEEVTSFIHIIGYTMDREELD